MKRSSSALFVIPAAILAACSSNNADLALFPSPEATEVNPDTYLSLTFKDTPFAGNSGKIRIFDADSGTAVDSIDMSIPAGPTEPRTYGPECDYTKIPYDYSRTSVPTNRDTRAGTPSGGAEPDSSAYQLNIIGGFTDAFHFHPVIAKDSVARIYIHNNMLDYGKTYVVTIDSGVINLPDASFKGIGYNDGWTFSTKRSAPSLEADTITVSADGRADFTTLQGALDFIPDFSDRKRVVAVAPGDYEEIVYARNKSNIEIVGAGSDKTRIHYANNEVFNPHPVNLKTNEWRGTFPSRRAAVMFDNCHDITLRDITAATDLKGQAEGLLLNGERISLYNVHIIGDGDALQANGTIYMENCRIEGGGDTILGRGSIFAYRCELLNDGGPFTWVRNTGDDHGDIFVECTFSTLTDSVEADFGRTKTNHGTAYPDSEMVVIDCKVKNIIPAGWSSIGLPTARMLEYNTTDLDTGEKTDVAQRHRYSRQLVLPADSALINSYRDPAFVLKGWNPQTSGQR